jgi:hypothetical protein
MQIRVDDGSVQEFRLADNILYRVTAEGTAIVRRTDPVLRLWRVVEANHAERDALENSPYRIAFIEGLSSTAELSIPDSQITGRLSHPERFLGETSELADRGTGEASQDLEASSTAKAPEDELTAEDEAEAARRAQPEHSDDTPPAS